jgi:hypothetical protein
VGLDEGGELGEQLVLLFGDLVDPAQLGLGDAQLWAGRQLPELAREPRAVARGSKRLRTELGLELRRDADQMPAAG